MTTKLILGALFLCLANPIWAGDPWLGTWKLNVEKSKFDPGPPPKSRIRVVEAVGEQIRSTMESMQSNGETSKSVWTGAPDGKSYPVEASTPGYAAAVKQSGPDVQELTVTLNGKPAWKSRSTLSKDGKTINSVVTGTTPKGEKLHNVTVWEKQ